MHLLLPLFALLLLTSCNAKEYQYEQAIDGDTIIASGQKIRLWGIDAPELNEPQGNEAKLFIEVLLFEKTLKCEPKYQDTFGNDVMRCYVGNYDVSAEMVKMGMASEFKKYSNSLYTREENEARRNKLGIWRE